MSYLKYFYHILTESRILLICKIHPVGNILKFSFQHKNFPLLNWNIKNNFILLLNKTWIEYPNHNPRFGVKTFCSPTEGHTLWGCFNLNINTEFIVHVIRVLITTLESMLVQYESLGFLHWLTFEYCNRLDI